MSKTSYTRRQVCQLGLSSVAGLTLLDLTACGDTTSTSSKPNETLQLSFWGDASRNKLTKKAISAFRQNNSNITINSWFTDFSTYYSKLNTQIAGGSSPDLIQMDMSFVKEYATEKITLDLSSYIANKTIDLSDFDQGMYKSSNYNNVPYGISLGGNYECMVYDATLVQQSGVGNPKSTMTWDEFGTYLAEVSKGLASKGIYGATDMSGAIDMLEIWIRQLGKEVYTADGQPGFTADDIAGWFNYWSKLRASGACAPAQLQATVTGSGPAASLLAQGKAVFTNAHSNQFSAFQVLTKDTLALQAPPTGPQLGLYLKPSMLMSISSHSKYAEDAARFINFLITDPAGAKAIGLDRGIPGSARARNALTPILKPADKIVLAYAAAVGSQTRPKNVLDPSGAAKIQTALGPISQSVAFGKVSVTDGAASFLQTAQKTLSKS
jgi:multiple sugar transport system substrate-binding protein